MPKLAGTSDEVRKPSTEGKKAGVTGGGWGAVAAKKQANDNAPRNSYFAMRLKDKESAVVQFLDDEPFCFEGHDHARFKWNIRACQLTKQKHCLMCDAGIKLVWKAAFRVLDFRGTWDKDKKKFMYDKPAERVLFASNTMALQIKGLKDKYGKELTELVLEITRSGSGAKDTTYNFERAFGKDDTLRKPIPHKPILKPLREAIFPPSDNELIALGISGGKMDDSDTGEAETSDLPY